MVRATRICAISLLLLGGASLSAQGSIQQEASGRVVVLPDSAMPHALTRCSRGGPTGVSGFWRPSPADVAAAEDAVDRALARALDSVIARDTVGHREWLDRPRTRWADEYYRQYVGLRYRDGRRTIYINGLAAGWPMELSERVGQSEAGGSHPYAKPDWWRFIAAHVCDGGEFFFGAEYDPVSKRVLSFQFNTRA
jgi:hypothetical protein